jgi:hypothetical protein
VAGREGSLTATQRKPPPQCGRGQPVVPQSTSPSLEEAGGGVGWVHCFASSPPRNEGRSLTTALNSARQGDLAAMLDRTEPWGDCLLWTGRVNEKGYGQASYAGRTIGAHRAAFFLAIGELPAGVPLDHMCHTRACPGGITCAHRRCINPAHLMPTTNAENSRRGWTGRRNAENRVQGLCQRGHLWAGPNLRPRLMRDGTVLVCLECERERKRRLRKRRSGGVPAVDQPAANLAKVTTSEWCRAGLHRWQDQTPIAGPYGRECRLCCNERKRRARRRQQLGSH